jgi:hypothetical protein
MSRQDARPPEATDGQDPAVAFPALVPVLERYARETAIAPGAELVARIVARIDAAPHPVRPWSFIGSLARLRVGQTLQDLGDTTRSTFDRSVSTLFRAQAIVILLLAVLTIGALGAVGAATVAPIVEGFVRQDRQSADRAPTPRSVERTRIVPDEPATKARRPDPPRALAPAQGPAGLDRGDLPGQRRAVGQADREAADEPGRRRALGREDRDADERPGRRRALGHERRDPQAARGRGDGRGASKDKESSGKHRGHSDKKG